ncbi:hypothetical protein FHW20_001288 [Ochrobactrum intermedium]|uniref:Uncharacterized protein n=1 Tax=Brucella intermedia TaxID=94625 RepID=A0ABR6ALU3_9HYPH|nr:hypothetical protein [Brucella intermedia]SUA87752.1 Uncharacterised protein [Brucella intermedia]
MLTHHALKMLNRRTGLTKSQQDLVKQQNLAELRVQRTIAITLCHVGKRDRTD